MKLNPRSVSLYLSVAGGFLTVVFNVAIFVISFPGLAAESEALLPQTHLPAQGDVYRLPSPPAFLPDLNLRAADIGVNGAVPRPLLRYHPNDVLPLASLTKLMTALVVLDRQPDWSLVVTVSETDRRGGAKPSIF